MEELIAMVAEKTGLDEKQAEVAVELVLDFVKEKMPPAVGAQIDALLEGKGGLGAAADALGGLFG
ncbi:MAG: hypothetical protein HN855_16285 [Anaerolineae bacterium]|nr:hypothetical protein [Anaerolineae bacterium]MBT7069799.1 hypothetical protein [Anaerolineae bacterium]MBT7326709.1 hypothetical protein [Anaerolineae bacterium]